MNSYCFDSTGGADMLVRQEDTDAAETASVLFLGRESAELPGTQESSTMLSSEALAEIAQVEAEIDRIEAQSIERLGEPPDNQVQQVELLGKLMLYDKQLSVNRNEACAFCHTPETGFTGPVSELNRTTGSYPGSVRTRFSDRKPQSHAYAPLSPVLHYNPGQGDLVGGNFWDMRATGRRLGNPAAEQAQGPPTNPVEIGRPRHRLRRPSRRCDPIGPVRNRCGERRHLRSVARRGMTCSAARHNATPATATAVRARIRCSPISRRAISELPPTRGSLIM